MQTFSKLSTLHMEIRFVCMKLLDLIVANILCFQIIDIFSMNFATIILFLPRTFTHTHNLYPLPTTFSYTCITSCYISCHFSFPLIITQYRNICNSHLSHLVKTGCVIRDYSNNYYRKNAKYLTLGLMSLTQINKFHQLQY